MPTYITLVNFQDGGMHSAVGLPSSWEDVRKTVESVGGTAEIYLTTGRYDSVVVTTFPSDNIAAKVLLGLQSHDSVSTYLKAYSEAEYRVLAKGTPHQA